MLNYELLFRVFWFHYTTYYSCHNFPIVGLMKVLLLFHVWIHFSDKVIVVHKIRDTEDSTESLMLSSSDVISSGSKGTYSQTLSIIPGFTQHLPAAASCCSTCTVPLLLQLSFTRLTGLWSHQQNISSTQMKRYYFLFKTLLTWVTRKCPSGNALFISPHLLLTVLLLYEVERNVTLISSFVVLKTASDVFLGEVTSFIPSQSNSDMNHNVCHTMCYWRIIAHSCIYSCHMKSTQLHISVKMTDSFLVNVCLWLLRELKRLTEPLYKWVGALLTAVFNKVILILHYFLIFRV